MGLIWHPLTPPLSAMCKKDPFRSRVASLVIPYHRLKFPLCTLPPSPGKAPYSNGLCVTPTFQFSNLPDGKRKSTSVSWMCILTWVTFSLFLSAHQTKQDNRQVQQLMLRLQYYHLMNVECYIASCVLQQTKHVLVGHMRTMCTMCTIAQLHICIMHIMHMCDVHYVHCTCVHVHYVTACCIKNVMQLTTCCIRCM